MTKDGLARDISRVVRNGNCSGCGACSLVSDRVTMTLQDGFMRPEVQAAQQPTSDMVDTSRFRRVCPGVTMTKPPAEVSDHVIFGRHVSVWEGWAADEEIRHAGSSGGVLSALSIWVLAQEPGSRVTAVSGDAATPSRSVPVSIMTRAEALASSGSRYAPVSTLSPVLVEPGQAAFVGKPCEAAALRTFEEESDGPTPLLLSFFCAGTPSQTATTRVIESLGQEESEATHVRYRGEGWPGDFTVTSGSGEQATMSYEESWGSILGRDVQWRCKLCVDGTGESADIAVGDFWKTDERGFPVFEDAAGSSVVIARTARGHNALMAAATAGAVVLSPVDLDDVAAVQPLQVERRRTLLARLIGRRLAGFTTPRYLGYGLLRAAMSNPLLALKTAAGTYLRSRGLK